MRPTREASVDGRAEAKGVGETSLSRSKELPLTPSVTGLPGIDDLRHNCTPCSWLRHYYPCAVLE
jgi:hypothetical protein